jgi:hypothetical protein
MHFNVPNNFSPVQQQHIPPNMQQQPQQNIMQQMPQHSPMGQQPMVTNITSY